MKRLAQRLTRTGQTQTTQKGPFHFFNFLKHKNMDSLVPNPVPKYQLFQTLFHFNSDRKSYDTFVCTKIEVSSSGNYYGGVSSSLKNENILFSSLPDLIKNEIEIETKNYLERIAFLSSSI